MDLPPCESKKIKMDEENKVVLFIENRVINKIKTRKKNKIKIRLTADIKEIERLGIKAKSVLVLSDEDCYDLMRELDKMGYVFDLCYSADDKYYVNNHIVLALLCSIIGIPIIPFVLYWKVRHRILYSKYLVIYFY